MGILKKAAILSIILPFFLLTASFCCFKMMTAGASSMPGCSGMASSDSVGHGLNLNLLNLHGCPSHSAKCQCEQLTESYDKAGLKSADLHQSILNNPKAIAFT